MSTDNKFAGRIAPLPEISVEAIFNAMMAARGECEGNVVNLDLAAELEAELHDLLKAEFLDDSFIIHVYTVIVTPTTPDGRVEVRVAPCESNTFTITQARTAKLWELIHAAHPEPAI
jgi:hypothetical protein